MCTGCTKQKISQPLFRPVETKEGLAYYGVMKRLTVYRMKIPLSR